MHEWVDGEGLPIFPPPYTVETAYCHGCATVKAERDQIRAQAEDRADNIKLFLKRNPEQPDLTEDEDLLEDG